MNDSVETVSIELPKGIKHLHKPEIDVIAWSNQRGKSDLAHRYFFIFIILFLGGIIFLMSVNAFRLRPWEQGWGSSDFLGYLAAYLVIWLILLTLVFVFYSTLNWMESLSITDDHLVYTRSGLWVPKPKRFKQSRISKIFYGFGYEQDNVSNDSETGENLSIIFAILHGDLLHTEKLKAEIVAGWLSSEDRLQIFRLTEQICRERGWTVPFQHGKQIRFGQSVAE